MIYLFAGARPNFIKASSIIRAFKKYDIDFELIHSGQHYDLNMVKDFLPADSWFPDYCLPGWNAYSNPADQIGQTIRSFGEYCSIKKPDMIMVFGDVNSTLAGAIVANKLGIKLAHVEAGERCGNLSMPEEMNRILVDQMSDFLFAASEQAYDNIAGYDKDGLYLTGDTMIDQLVYYENEFKEYAVKNEKYAVLTLHRCANTDDENRMNKIFDVIYNISQKIKIFFPCHPRTKKAWKEYGFKNKTEGLIFEDPMPYLDFIAMLQNAEFVLTDSGGLQVETSYLNVPCITLRKRTERHDTINRGSNLLIDPDKNLLGHLQFNVDKILKRRWKQSTFKSNPIHDGKAAERIAEIIRWI